MYVCMHGDTYAHVYIPAYAYNANTYMQLLENPKPFIQNPYINPKPIKSPVYTYQSRIHRGSQCRALV